MGILGCCVVGLGFWRSWLKRLGSGLGDFSARLAKKIESTHKNFLQMQLTVPSTAHGCMQVAPVISELARTRCTTCSKASDS